MPTDNATKDRHAAPATASVSHAPTVSSAAAPNQSAKGSGQLTPNLHLPTGRAKWAMIAILYAANVNVSFMQSSMNVALDKVSSDYAIPLSDANWVVLGYAIIMGAVITMAASLLKRYGIRKVVLSALALALVGSLLGFFAWCFPVMLIARVLQAIATGLMYPIVSDALLTLAPNGKAGLLLSINSGVIGLGLAVAPLISGLMITYLGLNALFLLPAAVSAVLLVVAYFLLHNLYDRQNKKVDALSVILSLAALGSFMYGLNEITHALVVSLVLMGLAVILGALFVIRQKRLADPLLDLSPLKNKAFSLGETLMGLGYIASLYLSLLAPLFLEGTAGYTPFIAGCFLALPIACYAVFCFVSGAVVKRHGVWPLVTIGFAVVLLGFIAMYFASSADMMVPFLICVGASYAGIGLLFPATKSADLEVLPKNIASSGSSIHSTLVQIAGSISSALFVGIMSSDVVNLMSHGTDKAAAYATGFSHTLLIAIGMLAAAFIASFFYSKIIVKISGNHV